MLVAASLGQGTRLVTELTVILTPPPKYFFLDKTPLEMCAHQVEKPTQQSKLQQADLNV